VLNDVIVNNELKKMYMEEGVKACFNYIRIHVHANIATKVEKELAT
jgi:hypothetical protein